MNPLTQEEPSLLGFLNFMIDQPWGYLVITAIVISACIHRVLQVAEKAQND